MNKKQFNKFFYKTIDFWVALLMTLSIMPILANGVHNPYDWYLVVVSVVGLMMLLRSLFTSE